MILECMCTCPDYGQYIPQLVRISVEFDSSYFVKCDIRTYYFRNKYWVIMVSKRSGTPLRNHIMVSLYCTLKRNGLRAFPRSTFQIKHNRDLRCQPARTLTIYTGYFGFWCRCIMVATGSNVAGMIYIVVRLIDRDHLLALDKKGGPFGAATSRHRVVWESREGNPIDEMLNMSHSRAIPAATRHNASHVPPLVLSIKEVGFCAGGRRPQNLYWAAQAGDLDRSPSSAASVTRFLPFFCESIPPAPYSPIRPGLAAHPAHSVARPRWHPASVFRLSDTHSSSSAGPSRLSYLSCCAPSLAVPAQDQVRTYTVGMIYGIRFLSGLTGVFGRVAQENKKNKTRQDKKKQKEQNKTGKTKTNPSRCHKSQGKRCLSGQEDEVKRKHGAHERALLTSFTNGSLGRLTRMASLFCAALPTSFTTLPMPFLLANAQSSYPDALLHRLNRLPTHL
ncbi:hypothetical protein AG1IA_09709 [Rhizoctonia solani AG-1 IA]|uniref:Uncharacterized protein n=1 Tax=Thanatephorus cucumeris (strain AG1-IA) TaxID=983506 RepID=L8WHS7_THACA|nr:hypothetical protein AG1IA_09709 [Rhizoctonia solani AG-1 IA]